MTWFERAFTAWSLAAIAFSLGCLVRGESDNGIHAAGISIHAVVVISYLRSYLRRRLTTRAAGR